MNSDIERHNYHIQPLLRHVIALAQSYFFERENQIIIQHTDIVKSSSHFVVKLHYSHRETLDKMETVVLKYDYDDLQTLKSEYKILRHLKKHNLRVPISYALVQEKLLIMENLVGLNSIIQSNSTVLLKIGNFLGQLYNISCYSEHNSPRTYVTFFETQLQNLVRRINTDFEPRISIEKKSLIKAFEKPIKELSAVIHENNLKEHFVLSHGDFSFRNMLMSEQKELYVIDWENACNRPLFYDLAWLKVEDQLTDMQIKGVYEGIAQLYAHISEYSWEICQTLVRVWEILALLESIQWTVQFLWRIKVKKSLVRFLSPYKYEDSLSWVLNLIELLNFKLKTSF